MRRSRNRHARGGGARNKSLIGKDTQGENVRQGRREGGGKKGKGIKFQAFGRGCGFLVGQVYSLMVLGNSSGTAQWSLRYRRC